MLAATYVSSSQFTVSGDYSALFEVGLAIKCSQGTDGILATYVADADYAGGLTTVTVDPTGLTANLTNVKYSYVSPSSLPNTVGSGGGIILPSSQQRVLQGVLPTSTYITAFADRAYFTYLGLTLVELTPKYVEAVLYDNAGSGTVVGEVGLFSSANPPNKTSQSLTKIVAGTINTATTYTVCRNSSLFSTAVPSGTHLWAGIRTNYSSTQPRFYGHFNDMYQGQVLVTSSAGALTGAGPWTGAVGTGTDAALVIVPALRATLD